MPAGVYKGLTIELNGKTQALSTALRRSEREAKALQREMKGVKKTLDFDPSNTAAFNRQMQLLEQSVDGAAKKLEALKKAESTYGKDGMSTDAWTKLQYEIARTEADIEGFRSQMRQLAVDQGVAESALGKAGSKLTEWGARLEPIGEKMQSVGRTMTTHVTLPVIGAATASVKAATDIDTALTGVRKTVDGTEEQYRQLKDAAIEFSKTNAVSAAQVLDAQALGAQLGFDISELSEFSRVATGLEIATDMGLEDAASEMAQFANITQMGHDQIGNYASAIVNVGNNMATTESKVSSMAQRVAAAGTQVRMSQADILGWSGAMSSLGIEAEAGGTAFSQFVSKIDAAVATGNEDLAHYADVAGMSADEFSDAWRTSSTETLQALLRGIAGAENMTVALESMGVEGVRQSDVLKRLSGNTDLVAEALGVANEGWSENVALTNEVANRNDSLAAKFEMLKNRVIAVADEVGAPLADAMLEAIEAAKPLFEAIESGARSFSEMSEGEQQAVIQTVAIVAALGPALSVLGKVTSNVRVLGGAMSTLARVLATLDVATGGAEDGLREVADEAGNMTTKLKPASVAMGALKASAAMLAVAGIGVLASAIGGYLKDAETFNQATWKMVTAAGALDKPLLSQSNAVESTADKVSHYASEVEEAVRHQAEFAEKLSSAFSETMGDAAVAQSYADEIKELQENFDGSAEAQARLKAAVEGYNSATGSAVEVTNAEAGELSLSTEQLDANTQAWIANAKAKAAQEMQEEAVKDELESANALADAEDALAMARVGLDMATDPGEQAQYAAQVTQAEAAVRKARQTHDAAAQTLEKLSDSVAEYTQQAQLAAQTTGDFRNALESSGRDAGELDAVSERIGVKVDDLAAAMSNAGIFAQDFAKAGADSFEELYRSANGDLGKVRTGLQMLDSFEIGVKDFEVTDQGTVKLKSGEVVDLDKMTIDGKHFTVSDDGTVYVEGKAVDGLKSAITAVPTRWSTEMEVDTRDAEDALARVKSTLVAIVQDKWHIKVGASVGENAAGGISSSPVRAWAHADGGIVTRPTLTNVGLVGEAGAEAIIPLTNSHYVRPFAEAVASSMPEDERVQQITVQINGATVNHDAEIHAVVDDTLRTLIRKGLM